MTEPSWVPTGVNVEKPNSARIYDYLLGGGHNFAADRAAADQLLGILPESRDVARVNRDFLRRAVLFMLGNGVRQFLDLGSGIPTVGNVHEIAQPVDEHARVLYVDKEPVAVAHSSVLLESTPFATMIQADIRDASTILDRAARDGLLDLSRPVGVLMVAVLHFVPDEDKPAEIIARYRDRIPSGSYLALTHAVPDGPDGPVTKALSVYRNTTDPLNPRTPTEITALFTGFDLVDPGLVSTPQWRPESGPGSLDLARTEVVAGVARKP